MQDIHLETAGRSASFYSADAELRGEISQNGTGHALAAECHFLFGGRLAA